MEMSIEQVSSPPSLKHTYILIGYPNVGGEDEGRPIQTLRASFAKIKEFVASRVPDEIIPIESEVSLSEQSRGQADDEMMHD